jgi:hypothetical protein
MSVQKPCGSVVFLTLIILSLSQLISAQPTLASASFFGGAGDQYGYGISVQNGSILLGTYPAQVVRYAIPPGAPAASASLNGVVVGLTTVGSVIYGAGGAIPPTCGAVDNVGDVEGKTLFARYDVTTLNLIGCQSHNFFPYSGGESYNSIVNVPPYLYTAGTAETCGFGNNSLLLSKFDTSGNLLATVGEPGVDFGGFTCIGNSNSSRAITFNSSLYLVGFSKLSGEDGVNRPVLMKYGLDLTRQWKARPTDNQGGTFQGVTGFGGAIYAVGYVTNATNDFLIEKYDESGNRIWSKTSGGAGDDELNDIVAVGNNLYAVGYTTSQGAGGKDIVVLQIDPNTGNTINTTLYGGPNDDVAQSAATDGTDLYVVGTSNSFASQAGNLVGQNDVVLLRYTNVSGTNLFSGITNPLFSGTSGSCPSNWTCSGSPAPGFASYAPTSAQYPGGAPFATMAFSPTVYGGSGVIRQLTSLTWVGGTTYTLNLSTGLPLKELDGTVGVAGWPAAPNGAVRLYLTMGSGFGQVAAFDIPSPAPGTSASVPITFKLPTNSPAVGQQIGVMIYVSAPSLFSANFAIVE